MVDEQQFDVNILLEVILVGNIFCVLFDTQ